MVREKVGEERRRTGVLTADAGRLNEWRRVLDVATDLAKAHKAEDPETSAVYLAKSSESSSEVRLVEVSGSLGGAGEVLPFRFGPRNDLGVPYASVVVLLSFEDWARLERGELSLPVGWSSARELQKIA